MTNEPSRPELAAELKDLRARLADAEEALRAIRTGNVDAVLVTGEGGEQVYTLRGADRIYRQLIETMSEGAATVSADGGILYCNARLAEMLGRPLDQVLGTALRNYLPPADQQALDAILAQARTEPSRREINLKASEGGLVPVYLSASALPSEGAEVVFCLVLTDLTEHRRYEHIVEKERLAHLILEQAAEAIVVCDEQGRVIRASQAAQRFCDGSPLLRPFAEVLPLRTDASDPFHLAPVLRGETLWDVDVTLDRQGQRLDLILNAGPLKSGQQILGCVVTLTDITERKRATEAEAHLAAILEATPDLVGIADPEGRFVYLNRAGRKMLGIDELADLSGYNIREVHDAASAHVVLTEGIPTAMRERSWSGETELVALDGHAIAISQVVQAHKAPNGTLAFVSTIARDITERKRAEEALRESEARYRRFIEMAQEGFGETDLAGRIVSVNVRLNQMFGYTPGEMIGLNIVEDLVFPEDRAEIVERLQARSQGKAVTYEQRFRKKTGEPMWLNVSGAPITNANGVVLGSFAMMTDITERKRAEEEIRALSKFPSENPNPVLRIARDGTLLYINEAGMSLLPQWELTVGHASPPLLRKAVFQSMDSGSTQELDLEHGERVYSFFVAPIVPARYANLYGRDVTDRKQTEENLDRTARRLSLATESALIGTWDLDVERDVLIWDKRMYDLYGIRPEDFSGAYEAWKKGVHPADVVAADADMKDAIAGTGQLHTQFRVVWPDGQVHHLEAHAKVQRGPDGTPRRMIGVNWDITERKRAEEVREHRAAELQESQRIAGIGSWEWTIATGAITWSEGLNRILARGLDLPAPAFETLASFYTPESWERLGAAFAGTIETGAPYELELEMVRADGTTCWTTTRGEAIRGADGTVVKLRGTVHDITERKRAEGTLGLQSAALNAAANAMIITGRNGTIEWINAAFTSLTGYGAGEAIGKNPRELVKSGVHDQAFYKHLWDTILAGNVWHGEMTNRRKDGSLYPEELTVTPVKNDRGEVAHFIAIKRDLTEQHKLEAQFLQAQKMETVGQLAGGIAHDFNNLLTVINGTAELVLDQVSQDDQVHADVQEIFEAGERAAILTRQLLAFSRQQILESRVLSLNTVVAGMGSLLRRLLGEDIDLVIVPTPGLGSVKADLGQIEQVISNLAVNARDAMPQGGRLTIETQNVTIDENYARQHGVAAPSGPYVMLAVSDSGVGMDEATRARIFEPFFTTKGLGKGTGLGLSTVYGIVRQSRGFIWVYSEVGQGTSFKIYLPQVIEAAGPDQPGPAVVSSTGTETILLAEDNAGLSKLTTRILESAGYTVLGADTGEKALRLLEGHEESVHLLLSDVVMPGMSGRHLAEQLAQTRPGIKVLYMSGYTSDTVVRHGVLEAQVPFLNKPFTAAALLRKVREVLDS